MVAGRPVRPDGGAAGRRDRGGAADRRRRRAEAGAARSCTTRRRRSSAERGRPAGVAAQHVQRSRDVRPRRSSGRSRLHRRRRPPARAPARGADAALRQHRLAGGHLLQQRERALEVGGARARRRGFGSGTSPGRPGRARARSRPRRPPRRPRPGRCRSATACISCKQPVVVVEAPRHQHHAVCAAEPGLVQLVGIDQQAPVQHRQLCQRGHAPARRRTRRVSPATPARTASPAQPAAASGSAARTTSPPP